MRFLIVDDADEPLQALQEIIIDAGHQVVGTSRNGLEAISSYRDLLPDVLVMDVIMPRLNGMEALRQIREEFPQAQVILTCALNSCDTVLEAEQNGAAFCLFKPFNRDCVTNAIQQLSPENGLTDQVTTDSEELPTTPSAMPGRAVSKRSSA